MKIKASKSAIFSFTAVAFAALFAASPAFAQADGPGCTEGTLGGMMCNIINNAWDGPGIISGFSYMAGLICGLLGILKLKDHVESPNQVPFWDPMKRFIAGGAFLPFLL